MSLATLVNGADCGPLNPLQGLTKNLDSDRGLQQDYFGVNRAGPSRGVFRTAQTVPSSFGEDATRFFSASQRASPFPPLAQSSFDLNALRSTLPAPATTSSGTHTPSPLLPDQAPASSWATQFLTHTSKPQVAKSLQPATPQQHPGPSTREQLFQPSFPHTLQPQLPMREMSHISSFAHLPQTTTPNFHSGSQIDNKKLQNAFSSLEGQTSVGSTSELESLAESAASSPEADLLARTAGLLVQSVDHETNPKFANSQFLGLMKQLRDRQAIVEGNDIVAASPEGQMRETHTIFADLKGKGKAVPFSSTAIHDLGVSQSHIPSSVPRPSERATPIESEDANDAYFRQDNEDYINYWKAHHAPVSPLVTSSQDWQQLHHDWETFEATTTGVKRLAEYQFQPRNPYLLGDRSHNHVMHGGSTQRHLFSESVLEMEAVVQRDPSNARAWYELGVKQQENEREQQAISALQRSLELDPTHLPSWLALAISYTNEGDRHGTYEAIQNWIKYNEAYRDIVDTHQAGDGGESNGTDQFQKLIGCLIAMARGLSRPGTGGDDEVDADVQIALAVLLNTNEDYSRAQDCFRTALSVRPGDWLLYNRVGATLANGGRADEALSYYHRALEINPAYIRARFNLGISCISLKRHEEAAQYILDALVLQDSDGLPGPRDNRGVTSDALWQSLKSCCLHMERSDLAAMCDKQNLEGPFG
ncbi:hypothetical protein F5888DRAFT_1802201 [Russula emetica]|nr:hypothetical protein F5888DRAFT_1802201 [Russula emetica]